MPAPVTLAACISRDTVSSISLGVMALPSKRLMEDAFGNGFDSREWQPAVATIMSMPMIHFFIRASTICAKCLPRLHFCPLFGKVDPWHTTMR